MVRSVLTILLSVMTIKATEIERIKWAFDERTSVIDSTRAIVDSTRTVTIARSKEGYIIEELGLQVENVEALKPGKYKIVCTYLNPDIVIPIRNVAKELEDLELHNKRVAIKYPYTLNCNFEAVEYKSNKRTGVYIMSARVVEAREKEGYKFTALKIFDSRYNNFFEYMVNDPFEVDKTMISLLGVPIGILIINK